VSVLGMVMGDAMLLVGIGIAIGIPLSIGAGRVMQSLLYGLSSFDAISAAAAVASLSLVAALAGYLPARRAAAVDPMVALRYE
jgi:ABC-type antimicrobial peptide transport system permease subunit